MNFYRSKQVLTGVVAAALIGLAPLASAMGHLPLEAADQPAGTSVTIDVVNMSKSGFVTIHGSNIDGSMIAPAALGHTFVESGKASKLVVELATAIAAGTKLYAMLHEDTGKLGIYEFGVDTTEFDAPYIHDGGPVVVPITMKERCYSGLIELDRCN